MNRTTAQPHARLEGFTLVEIMIVVAIIGILVAIAVPGWMKARAATQAKACMEAQTKMDGAVDNWAIDNGKPAGAQASANDLVGSTLYLKSYPVCPINTGSGTSAGTNIAIPAVGTASVCPNGITTPAFASHLR